MENHILLCLLTIMLRVVTSDMTGKLTFSVRCSRESTCRVLEMFWKGKCVDGKTARALSLTFKQEAASHRIKWMASLCVCQGVRNKLESKHVVAMEMRTRKVCRIEKQTRKVDLQKSRHAVGLETSSRRVCCIVLMFHF